MAHALPLPAAPVNVEVHVDWQGTTTMVGRLFPGGRGSAVTFEYSSAWLRRPDAFAIDPTSLPLQHGPHHRVTLFGSMQDCGPDRWGRILIDRAVRMGTLPQRPHRDLDYVLALDDDSRIGALRFRSEDGGSFLGAGSGRLPSVERLQPLLAAADAVHCHSETADDLHLLLGKGSPLGGARPKSAVLLADSEPGIAKFPKPDDTRDIPAGEILAMAVARAAGVQTADHRLVTVGKRSVAVITRFDREGAHRVPFLSAASLLGLGEGEAGSYTQIADGIRQWGGDARTELQELWRRMLFSLLASNCDDHLRNHGFLMHAPGQWSLAPAYDLNPVPEIDRALDNQTPISELREPPSIAAAMAVRDRFLVSANESQRILGEVLGAVANWRAIGRKLRIPAAVLDSYASAFEHPLRDEAVRLLKK